VPRWEEVVRAEAISGVTAMPAVGLLCFLFCIFNFFV
jgi:hypothetical protein